MWVRTEAGDRQRTVNHCDKNICGNCRALQSTVSQSKVTDAYKFFLDASKAITRSFKQIDLFYLIQGSLHLLCKSEANLIFFWVHFHLRWRCHAAYWAQTFRRNESSVKVWLKDFPTLWTWLEVTLREIISGLRLLIKLFWSKSSSGRKFKLLCSLKAKYKVTKCCDPYDPIMCFSRIIVTAQFLCWFYCTEWSKELM